MKLIEEAEEFEGCNEYEHCKAPMLIERLLEEIQETNHRYLDLQQVCDDQDKQIATMKAALIDRHLNMVEWIKECGYEYNPQMMQEMVFSDTYRIEAMHQLAREMPEIDWEDMKCPK